MNTAFSDLFVNLGGKAAELPKVLFLLIVMAPLFYVVYRVRNRSKADLGLYLLMVLVFLFLHRQYLAARCFASHDARGSLHLLWSLLNQYISLGDPGGWNSFMNGGEPFYLYSNIFLSSEWVAFVLLNKIMAFPINDLINLHFVFVALSYVTFALVFFSVLFRERTTVFFCTAAMMFGGTMAGIAGQTNLHSQYFTPLAALTVYLFLSRREWVWLCWAIFFLAVTTNRYFPHYVAVFLFVWACGWFIARRFARKDEEAKLASPRMRRVPYAVAALLLAAVALLPGVYTFRECVTDFVSPNRGNAALSERKQGAQHTVSLPLAHYTYLLHLPPGLVLPLKKQPPCATIDDFYTPQGWGSYATDTHEECVQYAHSVQFIGVVAVLLAGLSLVQNRRRTHLAFVFALAVLVYMGLGNSSILWRFCRNYVPFFYIRHSFHFHTIITFVIVVLAGYGYSLLVTDKVVRWGLILLTTVIGFEASWAGRHYFKTPPPEPAPFTYSASRSLYYGALTTETLPFDLNPLLQKTAVATHPLDNYVFWRAKSFDRLLHECPSLAEGAMFFTADRVWRLDELGKQLRIPLPRVENGSFEEWRLLPDGQPVPVGWLFESTGGGAMPARSDHVREGMSAAMLPGDPDKEAVSLTSMIPAGDLAGRCFEMAVWVKSDTTEASSVSIELLDGVSPARACFYRNSGQWEQLRVALTVSPGAKFLRLRCRAYSVADAPSIFDCVSLAEISPTLLPPARVVSARGDEPDALRVEVEMPQDGYLVRRENCHRGWTATVDGRPAPILPFAGALQCLKLDKGKHVVEYRFRSPYAALFWLHVIAALAGQVLFFILLIRWWDKTRSVAHPGDVPA